MAMLEKKDVTLLLYSMLRTELKLVAGENFTPQNLYVNVKIDVNSIHSNRKYLLKYPDREVWKFGKRDFSPSSQMVSLA